MTLLVDVGQIGRDERWSRLERQVEPGGEQVSLVGPVLTVSEAGLNARTFRSYGYQRSGRMPSLISGL